MTIVVGCGAGRSGTMTLAAILDRCGGFMCEHELRPLLPWVPSRSQYFARLAWLRAGRGDVASSYLPYLRWLLNDLPELRVVVTVRDPEEVATSFEAHIDAQEVPRRHHWFAHHGEGWALDPEYDPVFPKGDIPDRHAAIVDYARRYYEEALTLTHVYPGRLLPVFTGELGWRGTQREIFDFVGMPRGARRYSPGAHENRGPVMAAR